MKISVVVPAFNEEQHLGKCLESLLGQRFSGDYEIIVVDNDSTDRTASIAKSLGVKVVTELSKGVTQARKAGADRSAGDLIVQADADTTYPADWLSKIEAYFNKHPKSAALSGGYTYSSPPWWARVEYSWRRLINLSTAAFFGRPLQVSGATFSFRREAYLKTGGYSTEWLNPDQWGIAQHLHKFGRVGYDPNLVCITSPRRACKPLLHIVIDIISQLGLALGFVMKMLACWFQVQPGILVKKPFRAASLIMGLALVGVLAYGYAAPTSTVFGASFSGTSSGGKLVALTFDDSPSAACTSQILDILDRYGIKATFFMIGEKVQAYPDIARRALAEGNVIGNHSYSHDPNHALTMQGTRDIALDEQVIDAVLGIEPHLYRPPHGKQSPWEVAFCNKNDIAEIEWNVSANDQHRVLNFGQPTPQTFSRTIIDKVDDRDGKGSIVLLHDKSLTVESLPLIIEALQSQGYHFVTVPQLLNIPAYN